MKVTVLASGSSGNVTLFASGDTRVLVDAGLSVRALSARLRESGVTQPPTALVVTHAHSDHLGHAAAIGRAFGIPVYVTEATARAAGLHGSEVKLYSARTPFAVGELTVAPTPLPHDAAQVALVLSDGEGSAAIVTDLGEVPPALPGALAACDVVLIESNHDVDQLHRGPYPASLKKRILSARGHLSNAQTHALLRALPEVTNTVVLMHLSRTNNRASLALASAADALAGRPVRLMAASQEGTLVVDTAAPRAPLLVAADFPGVPPGLNSRKRQDARQLSFSW